MFYSGVMVRDRDMVDRIAEQWRTVRPDIDSSPLEAIGRISRLSRLIDRRLGENFARHGIEAWMYDVLATLRRSGDPYQLTAGDLGDQTMITTGAMTNRIDRLEERGLVERDTAPDDRRKVVVRLTSVGLELVDDIAPGHLETEREILSALSPRQQEDLVAHLRRLLVGLGDLPPDQDAGV